MIMPVFHGSSADYPKGTILDEEDIASIVSENLSSQQASAAMLTLSDLMKEDLSMFGDEEIIEMISAVIAKKIYKRTKPLRIGEDVMDAEHFGIRFEEVKSWE